MLAWFRSASFVNAPAERLAVVRILVGAFATIYLLARVPSLAFFDAERVSRFRPVGPVSLLDAPLSAPWPFVSWALAVGTGIAVTLGWRYRVTGPLFALCLCWVLSYRNSWGMIFHTENLLVLHAGVLGVCGAADAWSLDARRAGGAIPGSGFRYGWPLFALQWVLVLSYVAAGVAKLRASGFGWALGHELQSHVAFDALRKLELGGTHSPLGAALVSHGWVFAPLAWVTLAVELGAPLALLGGSVARAWCVLAWGFHFGVLLLMAIVFPYPLLVVAYAPFFRSENLWSRWLEPRFRRWKQGRVGA